MNDHLNDLPDGVFYEFQFRVVVAQKESCLRGREQPVVRLTWKFQNQPMISYEGGYHTIGDLVTSGIGAKLQVS